jgi:hypothetical protein
MAPPLSATLFLELAPIDAITIASDKRLAHVARYLVIERAVFGLDKR